MKFTHDSWVNPLTGFTISEEIRRAPNAREALNIARRYEHRAFRN